MLWLLQSVQGMSAAVTRVAVLNVHMEGNLGDEYETTPFLAKLSEWGAHVDLYLANWQPNNSLSPHAARQARLVDAIYDYPRKSGRLEGGDYDVLISAPGPRVIANLNSLSTATGAAVVVAGVSASNPRDWLPLPTARLVVFREIRSLQLAQARAELASAQMLLSGDFSFSFQPDEALLGYWLRHYRKLLLRRFGDQEQWHVLFIRDTAHLRAGTNATHLELRVLSDCAINQAGEQRTRTLVVEKARTILASSDLTPKGDGRLFYRLQRRLSLASDQIFPLEMVEQMLGLLGCCGPSEHRLGASRVMSVISDRYHPAMAAHRVGAAVHIIDTTVDGRVTQALSTKMVGACGMIARYNATATLHLNRVAWERMRQSIMSANATARQMPSKTQLATNLVFLKFHKTSGTVVAYDLYRALGRDFYSMNKSQYNKHAFVAHGCQQVPCLFVHHEVLPIYAKAGSKMLDAWAGVAQSPIFVTILRSPIARTISAYSYYRCGPRNASASMIWDHLNKSAGACACSRMHEYAGILDPHGLPQYVGLVEARDEFYALLSLEFELGTRVFEGSLPLMVGTNTMKQRLAAQELLGDAGFAAWLQGKAARDQLWYERGQQRWESWKSRYTPEAVSSKLRAIISARTRFRLRLGLNPQEPFQCPLTPEISARLPPLDVQVGFNRGFAYCS